MQSTLCFRSPTILGFDVVDAVVCPRDQQTWVMETMIGLRSHYSTYSSGDPLPCAARLTRGVCGEI